MNHTLGLFFYFEGRTDMENTTLKKAALKKTEWRLTQYFRRKAAVGRFERLLTKGRDRMAQIEKDMKNCNYTLEDTLGSISYDGMPKGKGTPSSAVERSLIRAHEHLEEELCRLIEREAQLITSITRTRDSVDLMEEALCCLDSDQMKFVTLRFSEGRPYRHMEEPMMLTYTTLQRWNVPIMEKLSDALDRMGEKLLAEYDAHDAEIV